MSITEPERLLAWSRCLSLPPGAVGQVFCYPLDVDFMTKKALHGYMTPGPDVGPVSYKWSSLGPWQCSILSGSSQEQIGQSLVALADVKLSTYVLLLDVSLSAFRMRSNNIKKV